MKNPKRYFDADITGMRHGKLTAIRKADFGKTQWVFKCDCGNEVTMCISKFRAVKSCGCREAETQKELAKMNTTHGMTNTRLYKTWCGIKARCNNPNAPHYNNYGGRGIMVCDEWHDSFTAFAEWAYKNGFSQSSTGNEQSIDRIDPNGNYEPSNCRWVTKLQQARNRSDTVYVEYKGNKITMSEFCEQNAYTGITKVYAFRHIKKGQNGEEIMECWHKHMKK